MDLLRLEISARTQSYKNAKPVTITLVSLKSHGTIGMKLKCLTFSVEYFLGLGPAYPTQQVLIKLA